MSLRSPVEQQDNTVQFASAKAPGKPLVLLYEQGKIAVWRVVIGPKAAEKPDTAAPLVDAQKACPGMHMGTEGGQSQLSATVREGDF